MTAIGYVTKNDNGSYKGQLKTVSIRADIDIIPNRDKSAETHPDFRVVTQGVEIGAGFGAAELSGEENADEMRTGNDGTRFLSNNAGGVLGGISTGQPIVARFAVKPTSSILTPRKTIDRAGAETEILTKGRHDPCVGIRAVPVGEAMMACVLADQALRHRGQVG